MKSAKIMTILVCLFILSMTLSVTQAQTSKAAEWKQRVADQMATGLRTPPGAKTAAANDTAETNTARPDRTGEARGRQDENNAEGAANRFRDSLAWQKNAFLGIWDLTLTFSDGSQVKSTLNVFSGRAEGEGSVIHAAEASLLLPNPTTPEQGAWEHVGGLRFIASYQGYAVDEKFEKPAGKIAFRHAIRLSGDQETFTGRAVFEVLDTEGKVVFTDYLETRAVRRHAVAP